VNSAFARTQRPDGTVLPQTFDNAWRAGSEPPVVKAGPKGAPRAQGDERILPGARRSPRETNTELS